MSLCGIIVLARCVSLIYDGGRGKCDVVHVNTGVSASASILLLLLFWLGDFEVRTALSYIGAFILDADSLVQWLCCFLSFCL